jgi:large subunit ribosomal protein L13
MKTFSATPADIQKKWLIVDADGVVLGRLATIVAQRLRGKHKPIYTPHMDCGDNVIVINAEKVRLTGKKKTDSIFYWHTGFPGGIKSSTPEQYIRNDKPERIIENAVRRMLPKGPLGRDIYANLRVYAGTEHGHEAQQPEVLDVASMNPKNKRA